ncbi:MAG: radical SAM protein, partial [Victivallales bacterium]|nr:radical SAM protein [Victivallales bacterium]
MHLRFSPDTYYRSIATDSLLWHKRNSACMLMEHAQVFLDELSWEWRDADEIVRKLAELFGMPESELDRDFREFCQPLIANGLLECDRPEGDGPAAAAPPSAAGSAVAAPAAASGRDDSWTPLGSFFERHGIPAEFHIDLTSACTERCVHCYIPEYANRFLDFELVKKALDEYKALGGLTVHLSGGECMMHPRFDDIVRYCREQNINMIVLSNLTLCNEERLAVLKEVDPQFVNVSLYSMDPAKHDAVTRLPGSWKRTMDAILACEAAGVHVRLAAPVLKENREGYGELATFAKAHRMHLVPDVDIFPQCDHDDSNLDHALSAAELAEFLRE